MKYLSAILLLLLVGCGFAPERGTGDVLAIGDSILAWNRPEGASIPDVVEKRSGRSVVNGSVPGASFLTNGVSAVIGLSIPRQYRAGDFEAVIVNGGANDLNSLCGCNRCDTVLDRLVSRDGTSGAYVDLLARIDVPVIIVGYYGTIRGGGGGFSGCQDELLELGIRLTRLASADPSVRFVRVRDAIDGDPAFYDSDRVHPSPAGSERIGGLVARALVAIDGPAR
ncbi:MAG: SGNH/GDSL hydrolase family protein [Pseudomonadota bacterium]